MSKASSSTRKPASATNPPRFAAVVVFPTPPLVEMMDTPCMALSVWVSKCEAERLGPVIEALGDPLINLRGFPADRPHSDAQFLRTLAFLHQGVDLGAFTSLFSLTLFASYL